MVTHCFAVRAHKAHSLAVVMAIAVLLAACSPASVTPSLPTGLAAAIQGRVDVGGYDLYYLCVGEGSPTVILEAGSTNDSTIWELVMLYDHGYTRMCAYDRANLGHSDRAPKPRTYEDMTRDLHALLLNAPIQGPYVLAGHSMGGMLVRLYANQYPEEVAGLVLVDSAHPEMGTRLGAALPPASPGEDKALATWRQYADWMSTATGRSLLIFGNGDPEGVNNLASNPQVSAVRSLGDLPLAVISRSPHNPIMVPGYPALPEEINTRLMQQWQDMQTELQGLSSNSTRFTADHSGHMLQLEEPRLVVEAIHQVVDAVRAQAGMETSPSPEPADAAGHAPVINAVTQRTEKQNGMLVIFEEFAFSDAAGDAISVVNTILFASETLALADDVIYTSPAEQKQGAHLSVPYRCRRAYQLTIEYRLLDWAGNLSNPQSATISCPDPNPGSNLPLLGGVALLLLLIGLGTWLLARTHRKKQPPMTPR